MGKALCHWEKFADSKRCLEIACGNLDKKETVSPIEVAEAYCEISMLYENMNEFETAISLLKRTLAILEKRPQEQQSEGGVSARIGWLLLLKGEVPQAIPYLENAVEKLKDSFGSRHFGVGYIYNNLGAAYLELDRPQSAAQIFAVAKDILDVSLGPYHADSIETCQNLSKAYSGMGSYTLAIEFQHRIKGLKNLNIQEMEKLVSSWFSNKTLPQSYIFPPEARPGNHVIPRCNTIPVVDLSKALAHDRIAIVQQILKASQEFGFFQVVNHGIPKNLVTDTMNVFKEFFELPAEDKVSVYSNDLKRPCRLYTSSSNYDHENVHLWRDNLRHPCHPLEDCIKIWPQKPTRYREIVATYSIEAKKLGLRILELLSEGLGLGSGFFGDELSESLLLSVNHYPPCPDPSLTLGVSRHCDPNLLTILHQGEVYGLQVFKDGEWIGVEPLHNAFVVNIGHQLQIISNNKLKSAEHRVVTNSRVARTTAAFFINPSDDCVIEPDKSLIDTEESPAYRPFQFKEFLLNYSSLMGNPEKCLEPFELHP
ncbi:hypothetical protein J1N35_009889 [Gossypium stocksii]|uniref:Fe2OG dioxygenase domain-containing protein n=1 Tax=Gossypium stocksii TaxID=47602 RepID=A0A9D3VZC7_9ROSI|nr:hypothetical protein J1N35_009889 [Gossypium stocksii]